MMGGSAETVKGSVRQLVLQLREYACWAGDAERAEWPKENLMRLRNAYVRFPTGYEHLPVV